MAILEFVLVLIAMILLHELGHFLACRLLNVEVEEFGSGVFRVKLYYGFMDDPHIPRALEAVTAKGAPLARPTS